MRVKNLTIAYWLIVNLGILLWITNWLANRPFFIDEANVARNLFDRSFSGLFAPLDHQQYAPPLYLILTKACGEIFGYSEQALRIPSLLGGIITIFGITHASKYLELKGWILLLLLLLFANPTVLRFINEVKPYSLDMGVASLILCLAIKDLAPSWKWVVVGTCVVWLSLPSVFVLCGVGITGIVVNKGNKTILWLGISFVWLVSFMVLYTSVLQKSVHSEYLKNFHGSYFFSLPFTKEFSYTKTIDLFLAQPRLAFGFTALAISWGLLILLFALVKNKNRYTSLLILPLIIVTFASSLGYYSLIPRLMLFTLPGLWLLAAIGSSLLAKKINTKSYSNYVPILIWSLIVTSTNVARHYFTPMKFSDSKALSTSYDKSYSPILNNISIPVYDYYNRIHPKHSNSLTGWVTVEDLKKSPNPGRYVFLYDVLTKRSIRSQIQADSLWAANQGASEIHLESLYHAALLYVELPYKHNLNND